MKRTDHSRFHFIYILAALASATGGLKRYFFTDVDHIAGCWFLVAGKVPDKGSIVTGLKLSLQETSNQ